MHPPLVSRLHVHVQCSALVEYMRMATDPASMIRLRQLADNTSVGGDLSICLGIPTGSKTFPCLHLRLLTSIPTSSDKQYIRAYRVLPIFPTISGLIHVTITASSPPLLCRIHWVIIDRHEKTNLPARSPIVPRTCSSASSSSKSSIAKEVDS